MSFHVPVLAALNPLSHVVQHPLHQRPLDLKSYLGSLGGVLTPEGRITILSDQIIMMVIAGALLVLFLPSLARRRKGTDEIGRLVPTGFASFLEVICEYLRKNVAQPALREHTDRFISYVWSAFFFVLTVNLLGLLPVHPISALFGTHIGGTATGNIFVTATMALLTMLMMIVNGLRLGGSHYLAHFCPGPAWLAPLLIPVEIMGLGAKTFALAVRLFANMIAGHMLLAVLVGLILMAGSSGGAGIGIAVAIPAVAGSVAIYCLEIFVAFLQAFIFTFLTAVFIGMSVVFHHDDHHEIHEGHEGHEGHGSENAARGHAH